MTLRRWQDLTTLEFEALDRETTVAVMPLGAIEQHGPHLPVSTDAVIAEEMAKRGLELVPAEVPALLMPTMTVGKSNEHLAYPGTLTVSAKTLMDLWFEVAEGVRRAGLSKVLFINAHGGQPQVMEIVARDLRVRHKMLCVTCNWWSLGLPEGVLEVVQGGPDTGRALAAHEDVDGILFTGSYPTGRALREATLDQPGKLLALARVLAGREGPERLCVRTKAATMRSINALKPSVPFPRTSAGNCLRPIT